MQVSVVTTWFPSARNEGAGSFIARDAQALAVDHDVKVIHLVDRTLDDGRRRFALGDVEVRRIPVDVRTPRGLVSSMRGLPRLLAGAEILHTMAAPALLPFLGARPRIPWVHTEHWTGVARVAGEGGLYRAARPLARRAFAWPDEVVAVSRHLADQIGALRDGPISIVGNIVDPLPAAVRSRDASDSRVRVLGVANVIERKGWRVAVAAVEALRADGTDAELVWLGDGPQAGELRRVGAAVLHHAPGFVGRDVLAQEMADADVFVLPTDVETFSLVTVEALAAGLPIVVTGEGAHTSFVTPGVGRVVSATADGVAEGVRQVRTFDRAAVRAQGSRLLRRFDEAAFRRAYAEVYERVSA